MTSSRGGDPAGSAASSRVAAIVAGGFGTVVAMWALGYVAHLPIARLSPRISLPAMVVVLLAGCFFTARGAPDPRWRGVGCGLLAALLNLLILGGMMADRVSEGGLLGSLAGFLIFGAGLGLLAGEAAARFPPEQPPRRDWLRLFPRVAVVATFLLVIIGGIVTSEEAGMAVPDWPSSFGTGMFLYPLGRMITQGGVYFEHAHRLFASLVGLTTVALGLFLWRYDSRRWVHATALGAVFLVLLQGVLGGLRVAQENQWQGETAAWVRLLMDISSALTLSAPKLRVIHGVLGQLFLGLLVFMAVVTGRSWREARSTELDGTARGKGRTDCWQCGLLALALVLQLGLGAGVRHLGRDPFLVPHIVLATLVAGLGLLVGTRAAVLHGSVPPLARGGRALLIALPLQLVLGFVALSFTGPVDAAGSTFVATAHQAGGALLLSVVTAHVTTVFRRFAPPLATVTPREVKVL